MLCMLHIFETYMYLYVYVHVGTYIAYIQNLY